MAGFDVDAAIESAKNFQEQLQAVEKEQPDLIKALQMMFEDCVNIAGLKIAGRIFLGKSVEQATRTISKYKE